MLNIYLTAVPKYASYKTQIWWYFEAKMLNKYFALETPARYKIGLLSLTSPKRVQIKPISCNIVQDQYTTLIYY